MTSNPSVNQPVYYADYLAVMEEALSAPAWLKERRAAAWQQFAAVGFPTARRGNEPWKYTNVSPIARASFSRSPLVCSAGWPAELPGHVFGGDNGATAAEAGFRSLALINGDTAAAVGRSEAPEPGTGCFTFHRLRQALERPADPLRQLLARLAPQDDAFVALNTALFDDGVYIHLPDDCPEEVLLNIVYYTSRSQADTVSCPRTLIVAGRNTSLTIVEQYVGPGPKAAGSMAGQYFTNAVTEVSVGEGARLRHYRLLNESPTAFHVGNTRVVQARDSSYAAGSFAMGAALARHGLSVLLDGVGAYCSLNGLYLTDDAQHVDNLVSIDHAHPHGTSRLYYKGILDGRSRAVFGGTVLVRENAQQTDAQQTDKNLLLSAHAEVDSKPSLLIYADDVKCGHGATAGHIDEDTLFYMRSRGLDQTTASQLLIHAFASEIIDTVPQDDLRENLDQLFMRQVSGKTIVDGGASHDSGQRQGGA